MDLQWVDLAKLLAAVAAGALIGIERELADKPAGFRTNIMICLGAAIFTLLSVKMADPGAGVDRTRIAAQVVTGVGFLGAGAIVQFRGNVLGLTTAATIWAVASVGMAFGAGDFGLGTLGTLLASGVLFGLGYTEARIGKWRSIATFELELESVVDADGLINRLVQAAGVQKRSWNVSKTPTSLHGHLTVVGQAPNLDAVGRALLQEKSILALRRL